MHQLTAIISEAVELKQLLLKHKKGLQLAQQANNEQHVKIIREALQELNSHTIGGTQS